MVLHYMRYRLLVLIGLVCFAGCASMVPEIDPPKVSLVSFKSLPVEGAAPRFEITLRVMNPNKQTLDIAGISYSIELLGRELITGVAKDISPIEGYSEGDITLEAGLQLLELLRLMAGMGSTGSEPLAYTLSAKIDFNGFVPTQRIEETGEINLN